MPNSIFDVIGDLDNAARIPALRAVVHSSMAKCIGAIRQDIRQRARAQREEVAEAGMLEVDQRNGFDEDNRAPNETAMAMGFAVDIPPLAQASLLHAVYECALTDLHTLRVSKWETPLTLPAMLKFMTDKTPKLDKALVKALADAAKCDEKTIERMHELQAQREKEQLVEATPEIISTFNGFDDNGYIDSIDELPTVVQHQMGVKIVESLNKARDQVLARVMRTRRMSELGSIPLIEEGVAKVSQWVEEFETTHSEEIQTAIEAGRFIRSLEDVATI